MVVTAKINFGGVFCWLGLWKKFTRRVRRRVGRIPSELPELRVLLLGISFRGIKQRITNYVLQTQT